ncbi:MAG: CBS domain-containing protein [Geminicoccaceae bacterium]|jgi:CBS domain-containing protein
MNIDMILTRKGRMVLTVPSGTTVGEAIHRMRNERVSALVVSEDGTIIDGIVSDRGLMNALADHGTAVLDRRLGDVMTREVFTCSRDDSVGAIMAAMTDRRIRHIPVVEEDGRLCGIVSIGDVVKHHLDEIQREASELREYISGSN